MSPCWSTSQARYALTAVLLCALAGALTPKTRRLLSLQERSQTSRTCATEAPTPRQVRCCAAHALARCLTARTDILSGFFEPPPDAAACAAILRTVSDAASAPPAPPPLPAAAPADAEAASGALNVFAADFAAALPHLAASLPSGDDVALGFASGSDGGDSDGEWWREGDLEADPAALWGDAPDAAEAAWRGGGDDDDAMYEPEAYDDETHAEGAAAADAAVRALAARFESIDQATICAVMLSVGCNMTAAEAALQEMANAPPPPPPPPPALDDAASFPSLGGGAAPPAPRSIAARSASRGGAPAA